MKLRFRNNSLRLRLNRREAEALASGEKLQEEVLFPEGTALSYSLEATALTQPEVSFQQGVIRIAAPGLELKKWAEGSAIGIYFELPAPRSVLKIAIEKDLECVEAPPEERDPHAYPRTACETC